MSMKRFLKTFFITHFALTAVLVLFFAWLEDCASCSAGWWDIIFSIAATAVLAFIPALFCSFVLSSPRRVNLNPVRSEGGSFNSVPSPIIIIGSILIIGYLLHFLLPEVPPSDGPFSGINEALTRLLFYGIFLTTLISAIIGIVIKSIKK